MTPVYIATLGYSPIYVGLVLAAIIGGNIFSNILLTWFGKRIGIQRALLAFSLLMFTSGVLLYLTAYFPLILLAGFIGNISTTGTEAGPFQSIETGVMPNFAPVRIGRAYGIYNLLGYIASALGAFAASIPSHFALSITSFHYLYLAYGVVGLLLFFIYWSLKDLDTSRVSYSQEKPKLTNETARSDMKKLAILNGCDAFGGGFVSQSLLSYWFFYVYKVSLGNLGTIFFIANIITAISIFLAPLIAERLGNLRTMVFTHLLSNVFLIAIPIVGSLILALSFLFLRQCFSQMDVPTRQTFMVEIFQKEDRVRANAVTNTARGIASIFGAPISGALLAVDLVLIPILAGGITKIAYDSAIFLVYRKRAR